MTECETTIDLKAFIRNIPDYPKPGIHFKDITTLLKNGEVLRYSVREMSRLFSQDSYDIIAGLESRGFILGAPLAYEIGKPFVPIRKAGKLPYHSVKESYGLEYGKDCIEMHVDAVTKGQRVLIVDDLLATGGTLRAAANLVERVEGVVAGCALLIELDELRGREKLNGYDVRSVLHY